MRAVVIGNHLRFGNAGIAPVAATFGLEVACTLQHHLVAGLQRFQSRFISKNGDNAGLVNQIEAILIYQRRANNALNSNLAVQLCCNRIRNRNILCICLPHLHLNGYLFGVGYTLMLCSNCDGNRSGLQAIHHIVLNRDNRRITGSIA